MRYYFLIIMYYLMLMFSPASGADEITVGVSFSIPPYVIQKNDSGVELDILKQALAEMGHTPKIEYLPLSRTFQLFKDNEIDAVINVVPGVLDGYLSNVVIEFNNVAITLSRRSETINSLMDLKGKDIVTFQKATQLLGPAFREVVNHSKNVLEVANQLIQINLLFLGRTDVVIMDRRIFQYFRKLAFDNPENGQNFKKALRQQVTYHQIFPLSPYRFIFKSKKIRDDFNAGLLILRLSGEYENIIRKYASEFTVE